MKLAEALQARSDLKKQLNQLEYRMSSNALVQEGEQPNEKPSELFKQYNDGLKQLEELIIRINLTNSRAKVDGVTLTELIARRDTLKQKIDAYRSVLSTASSNTSRATRTEIKVLSTINVESFQKDVDRMSKELRELDNKIQEANWKIELK
ncbi:MAG: DIP1984 family protein [Erysipelotrichaceae bacterium]|nr:DIP1984 family protein [Erysipelotrichaceae bacterium]MBR6958538.1 DIP1984 family protein [Erysipelotrichaceae bacterium]